MEAMFWQDFLFPVPMLMTLITGDTISNLSIGTALVQFPLYGVVFGGLTHGAQDWPRTVLAVVGIHLLAVLACFGGAVPNFS